MSDSFSRELEQHSHND